MYMCTYFYTSAVSLGTDVLPEVPDLPTPQPSPSKLDLTPRKDAPSLSSLTKRPPSLVKSPSWPRNASLTVGRKKSLSQVCCRDRPNCVGGCVGVHTNSHTTHTSRVCTYIRTYLHTRALVHCICSDLFCR